MGGILDVQTSLSQGRFESAAIDCCFFGGTDDARYNGRKPAAARRQADGFLPLWYTGDLSASPQPYGTRLGTPCFVIFTSRAAGRSVTSAKKEEPWVKATTAKRTTRRTKRSSRTRSRRPSRRTRSRGSHLRARGGADDFLDSIVHLRQPMRRARGESAGRPRGDLGCHGHARMATHRCGTSVPTASVGMASEFPDTLTQQVVWANLRPWAFSNRPPHGAILLPDR